MSGEVETGVGRRSEVLGVLRRGGVFSATEEGPQAIVLKEDREYCSLHGHKVALYLTL